MTEPGALPDDSAGVAKPFYCASCGEEFASRDGMYQDSKGLWLHDEEGGMSCCGPVFEKEKRP